MTLLYLLMAQATPAAGNFQQVVIMGILSAVTGLIAGALAAWTAQRSIRANTINQVVADRAKVVAAEISALALIEAGRRDELRDEVKHLRLEVGDLKEQLSTVNKLLVEAAEQRASDRVWRREMLLVAHRCPAVKTTSCPVLELNTEELNLNLNLNLTETKKTIH